MKTYLIIITCLCVALFLFGLSIIGLVTLFEHFHIDREYLALTSFGLAILAIICFAAGTLPK
jgi:hypothetical protein